MNLETAEKITQVINSSKMEYIVDMYDNCYNFLINGKLRVKYCSKENGEPIGISITDKYIRIFNYIRYCDIKESIPILKLVLQLYAKLGTLIFTSISLSPLSEIEATSRELTELITNYKNLLNEKSRYN